MQRRRVVIVAFAAWLISTIGPGGPAFAGTAIGDPVVFVREVYARLAKGGDYIPPEDIYSARLHALWAGEASDAGGEVGRIDFLFWINGQDGVPSQVRIRTTSVEGRADRRIVVVKFRNGTKRQTLQFYFERLAGAWKLDDVVSLTAGDAWTLSLILKYGWMD
jgi:hypothetical protein